MFEKLQTIGKAFRLPGRLYAYDAIKTGNINSTFKVTYRTEDGRLKSYIVQKINTMVFKNPEEIMENIDKVTTHIRDHFPNEVTLHFHHTAEGKNYLYDEDGSFWRVMNYVDSVTFDATNDLGVISATGEASATSRTSWRISTDRCCTRRSPISTTLTSAWTSCLTTSPPTSWAGTMRRWRKSNSSPPCATRRAF